MNATHNPIPIPSAASAISQPARTPPDRSISGFGQYGNMTIAMLSESMMRAWFDRELIPGIGTNTNTPATRASVSRKPMSVAVDSDSSPRIAAEVPQNGNGVRRHFGEHPG